MIKFVIFTLPRTGSTLLSKSLNKHAEIFCDDEIFHFSFKDYFSINQFRFLKISFLSKKINYLINYPATFVRLKNFLDEYYTNKPNENIKARGFKLMYYQTFYVPGLINYFKKNDVKVILLLRQNIFKNALSDMLARKTGVYHKMVENEETISHFSKLNIDVATLKNKMEHIIYQNKKLKNIVNEMDFIKIRYEDFSDWNKTMNRIFEFLKVSHQDVSAGAKKLNPDKTEDMIDNFSEVETWLHQNNYGEFI